ncbi:hypothetical protein PR202_ga17617 [Eleusine coracana subsp. coracana]|uniref:Uncharacterized protein n=1 Tax=Eleusine coracana subsp. coracana TaxID=191504 RepID=A0AAV5CQ94_ELECO|nr:hypothetical protein PR202_ga17370 [Eleusine coracana subsp. coracana]GJN00435.1 hypothetical protein PR202_ga17617 [Eleusine coracana subsp. coracana]
MFARTLAARVRVGPRLAPSLACLLRRGYASRASASAAAAVDDIAIDEDSPSAASPSSSAAAVAATVPTVLQPRVLIYDGVCHLCHRGERDLALWGLFPWGIISLAANLGHSRLIGLDCTLF